ncbi:MAG: orotidine 5'-phosphate decarboxylase [Patescibacteria group bacterium]|nr:orotidine 5'-phosphate decarboxylase [Patescibacteria group bacterium]
MLDRRQKYLQISINSDLFNAERIISELINDRRIILEAGTPFLKRYGLEGLKFLKSKWQGYLVADWKTIDRGTTEVNLTLEGGAQAIIIMASAPLETIDTAIEKAKNLGIDTFLDFMNIENPLNILNQLKNLPDIALLHRGVDETEQSFRDKPLPFYEINRIKGRFDILVGIAGGDTIHEISSAIFNGADLIVVWKNFFNYQKGEIRRINEEFLREVR